MSDLPPKFVRDFKKIWFSNIGKTLTRSGYMILPKPDFENLLKVLDCEKPSGPTLVEFGLNPKLYELLSGERFTKNDKLANIRLVIKAFKNAGYDYAAVGAGCYSDFSFPGIVKRWRRRFL